jgi:hypothetical protein
MVPSRAHASTLGAQTTAEKSLSYSFSSRTRTLHRSLEITKHPIPRPVATQALILSQRAFGR